MILAECSWGSVWAAIPLHWPSSSVPAGTLNSEKTWAALSVWTSGSHFSPDVSSPHYGKGCQKCVPFCQSPYTVSIPQTSFSYELGLAFHWWLPRQLLSQTTGKSCSIHVTSNPGPPRGCPASLLTTNPNAFLTCFTPLDAEKQVCDRLAFESGPLPRVTAHPLDDPVLWTNKRSLLRCLRWHSKSWNELSPKMRDGWCTQYMMAEMERMSGLQPKADPVTYQGRFPANVLLHSNFIKGKPHLSLTVSFILSPRWQIFKEHLLCG